MGTKVELERGQAKAYLKLWPGGWVKIDPIEHFILVVSHYKVSLNPPLSVSIIIVCWRIITRSVYPVNGIIYVRTQCFGLNHTTN